MKNEVENNEYVPSSKASPSTAITSRKRSASAMSPAASPSKKSKPPSSPSLTIQKLKVGTHVQAKWGGKMYAGVIHKILARGNYDVEFPDDNSIAKINQRDVIVATVE